MKSFSVKLSKYENIYFAYFRNGKYSEPYLINLLNFEISNNPKLNYGIYFVSANNQEFVCYKLFNQNFKYIKLEKNSLNNHKELKQIEIFYFQPL